MIPLARRGRAFPGLMLAVILISAASCTSGGGVRNGTPTAHEDPVEVLRNSEGYVGEPIRAVTGLGKPEHICLIVYQAAKASDWPLAREASQAALRYGKPCIPGLIACLSSLDGDVRTVSDICLRRLCGDELCNRLGRSPSKWIEWWVTQ